MTDPVVTHALGKTFGKRTALHDVSLRVPAGQAVGLIGANGAGKSTLLKVLVNLQLPSSGRAEVLGQDSRKLEATVFERVGYMAEGQHLPAVQTVADLLAYCRPFYTRWDDALATRLLRTLDLSPSTGLPRGSRGERMKAALVATLAFHPEVLILDEPLEGLDPLTREQVVDGLLELVSAEGTTVLLASHDLDVLERLLDQVAMLHDGGLVFQEPLEALQARYRLVEVTGAGATPGLPLPAGCIDGREIAGGVRFLATDFEGDHVPEGLRQAFPGARIHVTRPALREAFVAHARALRHDRDTNRGAA
ncbi:multidrug ABC transporter ATP-binding protein [Luteitalea sp. TBR-22]|uniref:ABC transporter ATP-binding protein n=1 Tax=Luteitalea sp. TBR-22 TaxID=2802971 RepID=UPI001AFC1C1D|nr:ABC transporter ATP-binding protein [Luteitalea sp. TBR-22]BCS34361.1 multidrug ABC transporter ATP-binding protein [Luteitalea sp. TBR-22]